MLKTRWCSSLAKNFPNEEPSAVPYEEGAALRGENFSFQLAYCIDERNMTYRARLEVESPFGKALTVRQVRYVPVDLPANNMDVDYIGGKPGLYPDLLEELPADGAVLDLRQSWQSLWFKIRIPADFSPGKYQVKAKLSVEMVSKSFAPLVEERVFTVEVLNAVLPPQKLKYCNWFHCDCLADYYGVPVFSEEHWRIIQNFVKTAVDHGMNMLLTPVFTPPLDTEVGAERPTVQLVDVAVRRGKYVFGFEKLERWIAMARKCGIKYFEISHLFTQWGACATPKIMADVIGKQKRIFGWDVASDSREYTEFLEAFLPELTAFLKKHRLADKIYFHCSDEPNETHLEKYSHASGLLRRLLAGFKIMDALSHVEYFRQGLVTTPVPIVTKLEEFVEAGMPERWTYYCCGPELTYSNRFIAMASCRTRILGMQLYYFAVEGFLHWGYNFYYKRHSRGLLNPFLSQSGEGAWPSGDPFVVYPGAGGVPQDSLRFEVFSEALQDQRVLQALEGKIGRRSIMTLLDKYAPDGKFAMASYPKGEKNFLALREEINSLFRENFK